MKIWGVKADILFLIVLSAFFLLYNLGAGSLESWDEAFYAVASREILDTHSWLTLYQGGRLLFNKPPLYMWASALAYKFIGDSELSARLWSGLCGIGCVLLTYFLALKIFERRTALISGLVLLSTAHYIHYAKRGMLDIPLTLFVALSLYFFWLGRERPGYFIPSGITFGLAMMTKGAAGLLAPLVMLGYCLLSGELKLLRKPMWLGGIALGLLIALPWHLYEYLKYGQKFVNDYFLYHVLRRSAEPLEGHTGNIFYYFRTLVNKFRPWVAVGIFSVPYTVWLGTRRKREHLLLFAWIVVVIFVFTVAKTKLQWYIIPAYPALAISIAFFLNKVVKPKYTKVLILLCLLVLVLHVPYSHIFDLDHSPGIKTIAHRTGQLVNKTHLVYLYDSSEWPAVLYYFGVPVEGLSGEKIFELLRVPERNFCLIEKSRFEKLLHQHKKAAKFVTLASSGKYLLLSNHTD